ncbi:hypothetical protein EJ02DRAFT_467377 [Clathrospora elynae]|uniref:Uncharacterized protein n=1 Tax=Clathrospora elynae TaxID=706981 RepID=A0A6A5SKS9_9PLEO|nr:hypothetical protein EJ02DRAFT_467377 [Clathrospora elynae]
MAANESPSHDAVLALLPLVHVASRTAFPEDYELQDFSIAQARRQEDTSPPGAQAEPSASHTSATPSTTRIPSAPCFVIPTFLRFNMALRVLLIMVVPLIAIIAFAAVSHQNPSHHNTIFQSANTPRSLPAGGSRSPTLGPSFVWPTRSSWIPVSGCRPTRTRWVVLPKPADPTLYTPVKSLSTPIPTSTLLLKPSSSLPANPHTNAFRYGYKSLE